MSKTIGIVPNKVTYIIRGITVTSFYRNPESIQITNDSIRHQGEMIDMLMNFTAESTSCIM